MTLYQKDTPNFKPQSGTPRARARIVKFRTFIRRERYWEAAFSALESHFQDTLRSSRFSLGREKETEVESTDSLAKMQCD
jgi:hypothetical protein